MRKRPGFGRSWFFRRNGTGKGPRGPVFVIHWTSCPLGARCGLPYKGSFSKHGQKLWERDIRLREFKAGSSRAVPETTPVAVLWSPHLFPYRSPVLFHTQHPLRKRDKLHAPFGESYRRFFTVHFPWRGKCGNETRGISPGRWIFRDLICRKLLNCEDDKMWSYHANNDRKIVFMRYYISGDIRELCGNFLLAVMRFCSPPVLQLQSRKDGAPQLRTDIDFILPIL